MTLNIDVNNEEHMKKLNELLVKYEQLEKQTKKLYFATVKDVADMMRLFTKHGKNTV